MSSNFKKYLRESLGKSVDYLDNTDRSRWLYEQEGSDAGSDDGSEGGSDPASGGGSNPASVHSHEDSDGGSDGSDDGGLLKWLLLLLIAWGVKEALDTGNGGGGSSGGGSEGTTGSEGTDHSGGTDKGTDFGTDGHGVFPFGVPGHGGGAHP